MENVLQNNLKSSITGRIFAAAGVLAGLSATFTVWYFNPSTSKFFPTCLLHEMTGLNCPGCGLTRGFHALFHGDILAALNFNALLPVYLFIGVYFFVSLSLTVFRGRGLTFQIFRPVLLWGFFAVAIIFGFVRNLPYYPFTLLSP